jgi:HD-GYP domain-containing protein (c-di-GMP phosphodiesterase class II)
MADLSNLKSQLYSVLSSGALIRIAERVLFHINKEIVRHTERTSYLVMKIAHAYKLPERGSIRNLVFLSLFHTIGFFREDMFFNYSPYTNDVDYLSDTPEVKSKYMFACFYLEFMTPIRNDAIALDDFPGSFNRDAKNYLHQETYKSIISLCARVSDFVYRYPDKPLPDNLNDLAPGKLDPEIIAVFTQLNKNHELEDCIRDEGYLDELYDFINKMQFSEEDNKTLEKLLIYILDFKSTVTMSHSINTSCYALALGLRKDLTSEQLSKLFTSAVLHDIGKIVTPQRILEYPGKLSPEDMGIMRYHVNHSKRILKGLVPEEILDNVFRHHEKLNGSGYPQHLTASELNMTQRILTIADITSALCDSRSYKGKFSKDKVISIMREMTDNRELDGDLMNIIETDFDQIQEELPDLQSLMQVDFSKVIGKYNEYILHYSNSKADDSVVTNEDVIIDDVEELEELEDL